MRRKTGLACGWQIAQGNQDLAQFFAAGFARSFYIRIAKITRRSSFFAHASEAMAV
jgi:hypothetical protein